MRGGKAGSVFLLVILHQSFEGGLEDGAYGVALKGGGFGEFVAVVVGNAAYEVDLSMGEGKDVAEEELAEAVEEEGMDGWMLTMSCAERTQGGEETVG